MRLSSIAACGLLLLVLGCSGSIDKKIVGKYKAQMVAAEGKKDDPAAAMAKGMAEAFMASFTLEIKDDKTFSIAAMGMPVEGTWTTSGDKLTLTPTKVAGVDAKDAAKGSNNEPLELTVSADAKTLTPIKKSKTGEPDIKFVRE